MTSLTMDSNKGQVMYSTCPGAL